MVVGWYKTRDSKLCVGCAEGKAGYGYPIIEEDDEWPWGCRCDGCGKEILPAQKRLFAFKYWLSSEDGYELEGFEQIEAENEEQARSLLIERYLTDFPEPEWQRVIVLSFERVWHTRFQTWVDVNAPAWLVGV